jgi:DNA polymerase delta subunit 1
MREVNRNGKVPKYVRRIELVQKRSVMYYQQQTSHPFLKIVVALPTMVTSCRGKKFGFLNIKFMQRHEISKAFFV